MRYLIITKCYDEEELSNTNENITLESLPNEDVANSIMLDLSFIEYITKHGYHFNDDAAIYASSLMKNSNGVEHSWRPPLVRLVLVENGLTDYGSCTLGDITYLANMAYADFYPEILNSEIACIKYAYAVAHDTDGYEGIAFSRWLADLIGRHKTDVPWAEIN